MKEEDNIYDTIIIGEDISSFIETEQKTNDLKFIDGKLYQKVNLINYGDIVSIEERWDLIEGQ
jgi:hypothetical protein